MGNKKILLVDDDAEDRTIVEEAMHTVHSEVAMQFAESGEEALKIMNALFDEKTLPCLIVLDLNMPRMSGAEVLGALKSDNRFNRIPVIIYSTSINPYEQEKCMGMGAHSYVTKPVSYTGSIETARAFVLLCQSKPM